MRHEITAFGLVQLITMTSLAHAGTEAKNIGLLAAACFTASRVLEIDAQQAAITRQVTLDGNVQSLGTLEDEILANSGNQLLGIRRSDFTVDTWRVSVGNSPNHIFTDEPYVYVVNSLSPNVLQVFIRDPQSETPALLFLSQLDFGPNTSPQAIAKLGDFLFIPFFGPVSGGPGRVAEVDVSDPASPSVAYIYDLNGIDLHSFEGVTSSAYASGVAIRNGNVYVSLSNLEFVPPFTLRPGGPGMVAKIDLATGEISGINLGAENCLNTYWVASSGSALYASCAGRVTYDEAFHIVTVDRSSVVVITSGDMPGSSWNPTCAETGCTPPSVGRIVARGNNVYAADQSGRIFAAELVDNDWVERWGYHSVDGTSPLTVCPSAGFVPDLIALP